MITQGQDDDEKLTDGNNETFWESDGNHGQHWIRFVLLVYHTVVLRKPLINWVYHTSL